MKTSSIPRGTSRQRTADTKRDIIHNAIRRGWGICTVILPGHVQICSGFDIMYFAGGGGACTVTLPHTYFKLVQDYPLQLWLCLSFLDEEAGLCTKVLYPCIMGSVCPAQRALYPLPTLSYKIIRYLRNNYLSVTFGCGQ